MPTANPLSKDTSVVIALKEGIGNERTDAVTNIVAAHWKLLYKHLRAKHGKSPADAQAAIRMLIVRIHDRQFFAAFEPGQVPIRRFLRNRLDQYMIRGEAVSSGGSSQPLDFAAAEDEFRSDAEVAMDHPDEYFESEWVRTLFTIAVEELSKRLEAERKIDDFSLFFGHDLQDRSGNERLGLEDIASKLGMPITTAMNSLAKTRQRFHSILLDLVRSFCGSEEEYRREVSAFSGR